MPKLDLDSLVYLGFQKREDSRVPMIHFYRHEEVWGMFGSRNVRLNDGFLSYGKPGTDRRSIIIDVVLEPDRLWVSYREGNLSIDFGYFDKQGIPLNMDAKRILGRITQISFESFQNPIPLPKIR